MTTPVDRREVLRRALGLGLVIGSSHSSAVLSTDWLVSPDEVARGAEVIRVADTRQRVATRELRFAVR